MAYIPASEGSSRRSRKDWKFYQRIGAGTFPMEYFQIEDKFGTRPHPKLELYFVPAQITNHPYQPNIPVRELVLGITNIGAGIGRFPSVRFKTSASLSVCPFGIDGNHGFGIPQRPSEGGWALFRGGVDDVIYPGETLKITKLWQIGESMGTEGIPITVPVMLNNRAVKRRWVFKASTFSFDISCDGTATTALDSQLGEDSVLRDV